MKSSEFANPFNEKFEEFESSPAENRPSKWLWVLLSLTILCGGGVSWLWLKQNNAPLTTENQSTPAIPVRLQQLEVSKINNTSEFVGALEARQRVNLRPEAEGRIVNILISSGDNVNQGTPLIQLRPDKNQAQLNSAIARINSLKASLNRAESELRAAEAETSKEAAELELQKEELKRTSFLVSEGAQSAQDLDRVKRDRQAALASFEAAQKRIQAAEAAIEAANADLRQAEAEADLEQENLKDTEVVAPLTGNIGDIPVKIGDYVEITDTLTTITQNQALELRLAVSIEDTTKLSIGLPVELRTSPGGEPLIVGTISFISPTVDTTSQTVLAKANFPNPQGKLRDKQFVRARIIWEQVSGVLIPASAITRLGGQAFVFIAQNSETTKSEESTQTAEQRPVKLGSIQGNYYQVIDGVESGETLITSGLLNLSDGAVIMPESASSSTEASPSEFLAIGD
ncbi:efflux RND transporter periplasmic adaptor subunit [Pleurocapsa sp. PCC 7319]|uniref:efflux RND transporter periplasmic adaptor subunit n=1 Tax=Pleurocapsa sp. PCC 7319 TaxID=118161 RepID=UPI00034AF39C|nr:efflux RND transporter periplasmic adaptor subunit [Pleurocapsa sp. PCC 7319]